MLEYAAMGVGPGRGMTQSERNSVAWRQVLPVIAAFAILSTYAQFATRLEQGPDEPSHLEYIHILAWEHRLPTVAETHIVQHPPGYYAMMAVLWRLVGVEQRPLSLPRNYDSPDFMTPRGVVGRRVLRGASMLVGCATLWILALTIAALGVPPRHQGWILISIAANPMLQYIAAVVGNEILSVCYSSLICLCLVRWYRTGGLTVRGAAGLGVLVGLGLWIKVTTVFCVPALLVALWSAGPKAERLPRLLASLAALAVLGCGWPLYCHHISGDWFPNYVAPGNQSRQIFIMLHSGRGIVDIVLTILATSMVPDWSTPFVEPHIPGWVTLFFWLALAALPLVLWRRPGARLRWLAALSLAALMGSILAQTIITDWRIWIGGRYLLNGVGWIALMFAASVPRRRVPAVAGGRGTPLDVFLGTTAGFLLLGDVVWWYLVQLHYSLPP